MWIPQWLARRLQPPCEHPTPGTKEWTENGVKMILFYCPSCGFRTEGEKREIGTPVAEVKHESM